jgi:hypothetical protein
MIFQRVYNGLKENNTVPFKDIASMLPVLNLILVEASANILEELKEHGLDFTVSLESQKKKAFNRDQIYKV